LTQLEKLRLPYNVGIITQLVGREVLRHSDILLAQANAIKSERARINEELAVLDGIEVFHSDANFILFRVTDATRIFQELKQNGILIKNLDGTHPLLVNCLRVTVGTPDENSQFIRMLHTILDKPD
jgi:histidinol-phosphate aminotransferase